MDANKHEEEIAQRRGDAEGVMDVQGQPCDWKLKDGVYHVRGSLTISPIPAVEEHEGDDG